MFDKNVEVVWPEDDTEAKVDKTLRSLMSFPDLKFIRPAALGSTSVRFVSGAKCTTGARPNLEKDLNRYGRSNNVRQSVDLGRLEITCPKMFFKEHYSDVLKAAEAALTEEDQTINLSNPDWYKRLWPYFKSAVKNGAMKYKADARIDLSSGLAKVKSDETIAVLPDVLTSMQAMRDAINAQTDKTSVEHTIRTSLVRLWVAQFSAEAQAHAYTKTTRTFTAKEARKLLRGAAEICKSKKETVLVHFVGMPRIVTNFTPLRIAACSSTNHVSVGPKSWDWSGGEKMVKRVEYNLTTRAHGRPNEHLSNYCGGFNEIVQWMVNNADYNATMALHGDDPYGQKDEA